MRRPTPRIPDESWRPERSLSITDALEALLDDLELLYRHADDESPADPLPLSTGLYGLDDVLRGGIRIGAVTLLEADVRAQADALLFSIARRIARPALLNSASLLDATRWLVAGAAGVPAVCVATGHLTEHDWIAIAHAVGALAHKRLSISTASTLNGLAHVVRQQSGDVLLVHDLEHLGLASRDVV